MTSWINVCWIVMWHLWIKDFYTKGRNEMNLLVSIWIFFRYFVFVILKSNPLRRGNWGPNNGLLGIIDIQAHIFCLLEVNKLLKQWRIIYFSLPRPTSYLIPSGWINEQTNVLFRVLEIFKSQGKIHYTFYYYYRPKFARALPAVSA